MTLFTYDDTDIIDAVIKSGAYIFESDWHHKIEIILQTRETETEEADIEEAPDGQKQLMKALGKKVFKKVVYERTSYILRSHDTIFSINAEEKSDGIFFTFYTTDKLRLKDIEGLSAIAKRRRFITSKDLPFMFKRPTDYCDKYLKDVFYFDIKGLKKYLVDRHGDLFEEELIEALSSK